MDLGFDPVLKSNTISRELGAIPLNCSSDGEAAEQLADQLPATEAETKEPSEQENKAVDENIIFG